jgi:hypothetical protein
VILLTIITIFSAASAKQANDNANDIRNVLVQTCEESGNTLRVAQLGFDEAQINALARHQDESDAFRRAGVYEDLFPGDPARLNHLLDIAKEQTEAEVKELRELLEPLEPINCVDRYG